MDYSRRRAAHDDSDIDWRWWLVPLTFLLAALGMAFGLSIPSVDRSTDPVRSARASARPAPARPASTTVDPSLPRARAHDAAGAVETEDQPAPTF